MSDEGPVTFLSDEWVAAADKVLAAITPLAAALRVGFRITGEPCNDRPAAVASHVLILGPDRVGCQRGLEGASVTLEIGWELAVEIGRGRTSAQRAFLDGRIQLSGDPGELLGHQTALSTIDDRLGELATRTTY